MKSFLKRFVLCALVFCFCFLAVGCESETEITAAHISEITAARSTEYAIKVMLDEEDRLKEKYVDLQLRSSLDQQSLTFGEEGEQSFSIVLPRKDFWYNLTDLVSKANGVSGSAKFQSFEDFGTRVFCFTSKNDVDIKFRVVAGQTKQNEKTKEEILALSEPISDEVTVKMQKNQK